MASACWGRGPNDSNEAVLNCYKAYIGTTRQCHFRLAAENATVNRAIEGTTQINRFWRLFAHLMVELSLRVDYLPRQRVMIRSPPCLRPMMEVGKVLPSTTVTDNADRESEGLCGKAEQNYFTALVITSFSAFLYLFSNYHRYGLQPPNQLKVWSSNRNNFET